MDAVICKHTNYRVTACKAFDLCDCADYPEPPLSTGRHEMQEALFDPPTKVRWIDQQKARTTDPVTSHEAAEKAKPRMAGQRKRLMGAFAVGVPLTDEEAAIQAGLSLTSEYATRCSELRRAGWIKDTGETRVGLSGTHRIVCVATEEGRRALEASL